MNVRRAATTTVSLAIAILAVLIAFQGFVSTKEEAAPIAEPSTEPSPEAQSTARRIFVPPTYTEGSRTVLPLVFPDGSTAELTYPHEMRLAQLGVRPYNSVCVGDLSFHYGYDPEGVY